MPEFNAIMNNIGESSSSEIIVSKLLELEIHRDTKLKVDKVNFVMMNIRSQVKSILITLKLIEKSSSIYLKKFDSCNKKEVYEKLLKLRNIECFNFDISIKQCGLEMIFINKNNK